MAKGISSGQWWRNGHSHIDEAELWLKPMAAGGAYRRLLGASSKRLWPMWSADGRGALFHERRGRDREHLAPRRSTAERRSRSAAFTDGRVLFPAIAYDGRAIVFEREFEIWKLDTATGAAARVPVTLRGAPAAAGERRLTETSFRNMAVSPDGKKVARHRPWRDVRRPDQGRRSGPAHHRDRQAPRATSTWSPDSRRLAYVSDRGRRHPGDGVRLRHPEGTRAYRGNRPRRRPGLFARRQVAGLCPRPPGPSRPVPGQRKAGAGTRSSTAAPWTASRAPGWPGRPTAAGSPSRSPTASRSATSGWSRRRAARRGRSASWPTATPATNSRGRPTASTCCSTPRSAARTSRWSASTCCRTRPEVPRGRLPRPVQGRARRAVQQARPQGQGPRPQGRGRREALA